MTYDSEYEINAMAPQYIIFVSYIPVCFSHSYFTFSNSAPRLHKADTFIPLLLPGRYTPYRPLHSIIILCVSHRYYKITVAAATKVFGL